jgi:hypothetical protein
MKLVKCETLRHSEQDVKDFNMDNNMTSIITIGEMVMSINYNKEDELEAKKALFEKVKQYMFELAKDIKKCEDFNF